MTMPDQKTVCTVVSTIYFRNVFLQPAVSDNTRPALSKTFLVFWIFFCHVNQTVTIASTLSVK